MGDTNEVADDFSYKPQHPLPEEIQKMKQDDTVCRYCGVSYLIHNEIKKLEAKLENYRREIEQLQNFDKREAELICELQSTKKESDILSAKIKSQNEKITEMNKETEEKDERIISLQKEIQSLHKTYNSERDIWQSKYRYFRSACSIISGNLDKTKEAHKAFNEFVSTYQNSFIVLMKSTQNEVAAKLDDIMEENNSLKERAVLLVKENIKADENYKNALQVLQQKYEGKTKELKDTHEESIRLLTIDNQRYQEQIRRLMDAKEKQASQAQQSMQDLKKQIDVLTSSIKEQQTNGLNEKQILQDSLNRYKEEVNQLLDEREKANVDHESAVNELNEKNASDVKYYEKQLEMKNIELCNQRNEFEKEKHQQENKKKKMLLQMEEQYHKSLHEESEAYARKESKMKSAIEDFQLKCESTVSDLHQKIEILQKEHAKEMSALQGNLSYADNQLSDTKRQLNETKRLLNDANYHLGEVKRVQRTDSQCTKEESENYIRMIRDLRSTVEELRENIKSKEEKTYQQENEIGSLRDCVRRECEERYELTEALSNARTELLSMQRFSDNTKSSNNSNKTTRTDVLQPAPPPKHLPLSSDRRKSLSSCSQSTSSEESWNRHLSNKNRAKTKNFRHRTDPEMRNSFDGDLTKDSSSKHDTRSIRNKLRISINNSR